MEFLAGSLLELITQTSTNLPPDVRQAMSIAAEGETPDTQSSQALDIILRANNLAYEVDGTIVRIAPVSVFTAEKEDRRKQQEATESAAELPVLTRDPAWLGPAGAKAVASAITTTTVWTTW